MAENYENRYRKILIAEQKSTAKRFPKQADIAPYNTANSYHGLFPKEDNIPISLQTDTLEDPTLNADNQMRGERVSAFRSIGEYTQVGRLEKFFVNSILPATCAGKWDDFETRRAPSNIATKTYTFSSVSGSLTVIAGHILWAEGFTSSTNNGLKVASAGTTTTAVVKTSLSNESSPKGTIRIVGYEPASAANIKATGSAASPSLTFTGFKAADAGIKVGDWIKVGGIAVKNKFVHEGNNGWVKVDAINTAGTLVSLSHTSGDWAVETPATGVLVRLLFPDLMYNGKEEKKFLVVVEYSKMNRSIFYPNCIFHGNTINIPSPTEYMDFGFNIYGGRSYNDSTDWVSPTDGARVDPGDEQALLGNSEGVKRYWVAGKSLSVSDGHLVESFNLTTLAEPREIRCTGEDFPLAVILKDIKWSGTISAFMNDLSLRDYFQRQDSIEVEVAISDGKKSLIYSLLQSRITVAEEVVDDSALKFDITLSPYPKLVNDTLKKRTVRFAHAPYEDLI